MNVDKRPISLLPPVARIILSQLRTSSETPEVTRRCGSRERLVCDPFSIVHRPILPIPSRRDVIFAVSFTIDFEPTASGLLRHPASMPIVRSWESGLWIGNGFPRNYPALICQYHDRRRILYTFLDLISSIGGIGISRNPFDVGKGNANIEKSNTSHKKRYEGFFGDFDKRHEKLLFKSPSRKPLHILQKILTRN